LTKIIVVSGSSSGLGLNLSHQLLEDGWTVCGIDINPRHPDLKSDSYHHYLCDLSDFGQLHDMSKQLLSDIPCINALVNCAGIMPTCLAARFNAEQAERTYKINVIAPLLLSKLFLKKLKSSDNSRVINVTSIAAELTIPGEIIYASSKAALKHATSILAIEFARYNVSVFNIAPALIQTPMTCHLTKEQRSEMLRKQAIPFDLQPIEFTKAVLSILEMPFSSTGSVVYVGGIAN